MIVSLPPGTYTSGSTMLVSTPLTRDAKGDVNASWLFQVGSLFTTTNGAQADAVIYGRILSGATTAGATTLVNVTINVPAAF